MNTANMGPLDPEESPLAVRVRHVETGLADLKTQLTAQGTQYQHALNLVAERLTTQIGNVANDLKKRSEIPWQALGIILTFVTIVGALAYWPIRETQSDFKDAVRVVAESQSRLMDTLRTEYVSRAEQDYRAKRAEEDRNRIERDITGVKQYLADKIVARPEHEEKWRASEQRFGDIQRQLDEIKRQQGETYTARDAILDLKKEVDELTRRGWSQQP